MYIGHLGRYPMNRVETKMCSSWLTDAGEKDCRPGGTRVTFRGTIWQDICEVMKGSDVPESEWKYKWAQQACKGSKRGSWWKSRVQEIMTEERKAAASDTWAARHAKVTVKAADAVDSTEVAGRKLCPKCGSAVHPIGFKKHVEKCDGTPVRNRRVMCQVCRKEFTDIYLDKHKCKGPPAPATPVATGPRRRLNGKQPSAVSCTSRAAVSGAGTRRRIVGKRPPAASLLPLPVRKPKFVKRKRNQWKKIVPSGHKFPTAPVVDIPTLLPGGRCPYCKQVKHAQHIGQCKSAPWAVWVQDRRRRLKQKDPSTVSHWPYHCPFCKIACGDPQSFSTHLTICTKRRVASGLPVH